MIWIGLAVLLCLVYAFARRLPEPQIGTVLYQTQLKWWFLWLHRVSVAVMFILALAFGFFAATGTGGISTLDGIGIAMACAAIGVLVHSFRDQAITYLATDGVYYAGRFVPWGAIADARHGRTSVSLRNRGGKVVMEVGAIYSKMDVERVKSLVDSHLDDDARS